MSLFLYISSKLYADAAFSRVNVIVAENLSYSKMEQMKKAALLDVIHGIEEHRPDCEPPVDFGLDKEAETAALYAVQLDA